MNRRLHKILPEKPIQWLWTIVAAVIAGVVVLKIWHLFGPHDSVAVTNASTNPANPTSNELSEIDKTKNRPENPQIAPEASKDSGDILYLTRERKGREVIEGASSGEDIHRQRRVDSLYRNRWIQPDYQWSGWVRTQPVEGASGWTVDIDENDALNSTDFSIVLVTKDNLSDLRIGDRVEYHGKITAISSGGTIFISEANVSVK